MCIRSALTCRRRKKVVLLEAKQPPVKTNCVGRGLMVSLGGIQQEESKCSSSMRKSPLCQTDPPHQNQDWNVIPSHWWPVLKRLGWRGKPEGGSPRRQAQFILVNCVDNVKNDKHERVNWTASLRADMWYECSLVTTKVRDNKSSCFWVLSSPSSSFSFQS